MNKNKKLDQAGFSHVLLFFILVIVLGAIGFAGWRVYNMSKENSPKDSSDTANVHKDMAEEPDISLKNLGLTSLDSVLVSEYAVREYSDKGLKGFYVFGDPLSGGRINPNFEFSSLKNGVKIVSAIDGIVGFVKEQPDSKDYEVFIQPKEGSAWTIGYDHITKVAVKKGDTIKAGDVIGEPATQNNGATRFEIQINKDEDDVTTHYCPSVLLASSVKDKILGELSAMEGAWESTTGLELYDVAAQNPAGCLRKTMTSEETGAN